MSFKLEDYEEVKDRLPRFLKDHPKARIITEIVSPMDKLETVVFKASIYDEDTLLATGFSYEKEGANYINRTSHVENCETSAIGRALANYGYSGSKNRPSREEMIKVHKEENRPKPKDPKAEFKKIKDAIWKYIEANEGFIGFLIDHGLDPNEDDNIMAIYNQASSLKKQYKGNS